MGSSAPIARFEVGSELGAVFGPLKVPDAASPYGLAVSGSGQEFTFRVLASSGGHTGAFEVAIYTCPR
jgi:hypothetical protein